MQTPVRLGLSKFSMLACLGNEQHEEDGSRQFDSEPLPLVTLLLLVSEVRDSPGRFSAERRGGAPRCILLEALDPV